MENMIDIFGVNYYINLDSLSETLIVDNSYEDKTDKETKTKIVYDADGDEITREITTREFSKPKEYDSSKYETLRVMLEVVLSYNEEMDDTLGAYSALGKAPLPFKIAFNTLLKYGVLSEV